MVDGAGPAARSTGCERDRDGADGGRRRELSPEPGDEVDLGQGVAQLVAVALRHASGDHEAGAGPAPVGQRQDGLDRFLAGGVDEGTGVDHNEIGRVRALGAVIPLSSEIALQLVGVDLVLRAPQGLQPIEAHAVPHSLHQAECRLGDGTRQARRAGQPSGSSGTTCLTSERRA